MKLREFVRVPRLSHCVRFVDQISKDEDRTPLLTVGILFIFTHLSCVHLATFKIHSISRTPPNFKQRTSPEVVNNSGNQATSTSLARTPFLFASDRGCQFSTCVYWAVWGFTVRKKWVIMGRLGPSGFSVTECGHNMDWWPSHANLCTHGRVLWNQNSLQTVRDCQPKFLVGTHMQNQDLKSWWDTQNSCVCRIKK